MESSHPSIRTIFRQKGKKNKVSMGIIVEDNIPISEINKAFRKLVYKVNLATKYITPELIEEYQNPPIKVGDYYIFGPITLTMIAAIEYGLDLINEELENSIEEIKSIKGKILTDEELQNNWRLANSFDTWRDFMIYQKELLEFKPYYENKQLFYDFAFVKEVSPIEYLMEAVDAKGKFFKIKLLTVD